MGNIRDSVYLGKKEQYDAKLKLLAQSAQPEIWTFRNLKESDPFRILRSYFHFTYDRVEEEGKIIFSSDGQYSCMNTGLLTKHDEELVALFSRSNNPDYLPWYLVGFFSEIHKSFRDNFSRVPEIANYCKNASDLIFDSNLEIFADSTNKEHIIEDNFERFRRIGYDNKQLIEVMLDSALLKLKKKLLRNFKLALPFYYHNTETKNNKIQLLVPVYFPGNSPVKLALVLDKSTRNDGSQYYNAITVLPVEWAYMNARVIVKPDEEWARIIDEIDVSEKDDIIFD